MQNGEGWGRVRPGLDRRQFLGAVGAVGLGAAGASLLAACGSGGSSGAQKAGSGTLPAFKELNVVNPDMPGLSNGTPPAYLQYPANPKKVDSGVPASGGTISAFVQITGTPPAVGQNPYWQEMNRRLGTNLQMVTWGTDYADKLSTMVAGDSLTDLVQLSTSTTPNLLPLLQSKFQDLSQWLSGDAILKYPHLAALPTQAWKNVVFNGSIYGIPWPLGVIGADVKIRQDIIDELGLSTKMRDGKDFMALCKDLTSEKDQRWPLALISNAQVIVSQMMGVPNGWKVQGGKFISQYETQEFKQTLSMMTDIWKAGYIYPGSLGTVTDTNIFQWFNAGKTMIEVGGYTNWASLMNGGTQATPKFQLGGFLLPKWGGGGQAPHYQGSGMYTFTAFKKAPKARIQELLRVCNYLATPFGSEEYMFNKYGLPGRDYTLKGTDPAETQTGVTEASNLLVTYIATAPVPVYLPGFPDTAKTEYAYFKQLQSATAPLPTVGLVSNTATTKGASINTAITSLITDIVVGRQPLSAWSDGVQTWKSGGGDQIAKEYEQSLHKQKKSA